MTIPAGQDIPAADVAMLAADAPTVEVAVAPSQGITPMTTITAPVAADVSVNPKAPVRSQVTPTSAAPSAVATDILPGGTQTGPLIDSEKSPNSTTMERIILESRL
jgi:hypothetical protein